DSRMALQRFAERAATFHGSLHVLQHGLKARVRLLVGEDVEALDQRQACVYHRGEQAREGDQIFGRDSGADLQRAQFELLLDLDRIQLLLAQPGVHGGLVVRHHAAPAHLAGTGPVLPSEFSHSIVCLSRLPQTHLAALRVATLPSPSSITADWASGQKASWAHQNLTDAAP